MRSITKLIVALVVSLTSVLPASAQTTVPSLRALVRIFGMPNASLLLASDGYLYGTTFWEVTMGTARSIVSVRMALDTKPSTRSRRWTAPIPWAGSSSSVAPCGVTNSSGGTMLWGTIFVSSPARRSRSKFSTISTTRRAVVLQPAGFSRSTAFCTAPRSWRRTRQRDGVHVRSEYLGFVSRPCVRRLRG